MKPKGVIWIDKASDKINNNFDTVRLNKTTGLCVIRFKGTDIDGFVQNDEMKPALKSLEEGKSKNLIEFFTSKNT